MPSTEQEPVCNLDIWVYTDPDSYDVAESEVHVLMGEWLNELEQRILDLNPNYSIRSTIA